MDDPKAVLAAWEVDGPIASGWRNWPSVRIAIAAEQVALTKSGSYRGEIDGYAGPATRAARLAVSGMLPPAPHSPPPVVPAPPSTTIVVPSVWPLQSDMFGFYGDPRGAGGLNQSWYSANVVHVACPWELHMDAIKLHDIEIHRKCAESLTRVLGNIWDAAGRSQATIESMHYDRYSGSFNYRNKRGGSTLSCHAIGAAIDWDSEENEQHSHKHLFTDSSLLVVKFKEEGWIWGGDWSPDSIDAMHVQAARVH